MRHRDPLLVLANPLTIQHGASCCARIDAEARSIDAAATVQQKYKAGGTNKEESTETIRLVGHIVAARHGAKIRHTGLGYSHNILALERSGLRAWEAEWGFSTSVTSVGPTVAGSSRAATLECGGHHITNGVGRLVRNEYKGSLSALDQPAETAAHETHCLRSRCGFAGSRELHLNLVARRLRCHPRLLKSAPRSALILPHNADIKAQR